MAPRLSVIVPIYNVERYLPACLDSLASQTFQDLEVVMIDDGSPDGSADIAAEYAARDERFRLVRKENAGLGAARNTGLEHLSPESEFVAFVDSDDVIPSDAYRLMLASLDASGSDFVTGNVLHVNSSKIWQSPMHRFLSRGAVQGTHVTRDLRLLTDRIACNKVFRRDFWERHAFRFPEGVLYEDTPVVVPAQFLARSVDVMSSPTYYWRLRDGESAPSITQRRTEPKAVRDRTAAVLSVSRFFAGRPEPTAAEMKRQYDRTVLTGDLNIFLNVLPAGNDEFREEFFRVVNGYLDQVDPSLVMELPTQARVKWLLVRKHALPELLELFDSQRRGDRLVIEGMLRKYASFAALEGSSVELPKKALRIDREMKAHAPLTEIDWRDGKLHLAGHAWIDRLAQSSPRSAVKVLSIKRDGSRRRTIVPLRNVHAPDCTATLPQRQYNYDWAGWSYEFDPERLRQGKSWKEGVWHLGVGITSSGLVRKCAIHTSGGGAQNFATYRWLDDDFRLLPTTASGSLKLRVERVRALITDRRQVGEELEFEGHVREPMVPGETLRLAVTNRKSGEQFLYDAELSPAVDGRTPFRVRVPMQDVALLPEHIDETGTDVARGGADPTQVASRKWSTELVATDPATEKVRRFGTVMADDLPDLQVRLPRSFGEDAAGFELAVVAGNTGYLKLTGRTLRARITEVRWADGRFSVYGTAPRPVRDCTFLVKARDYFDEKSVELKADANGRFEAHFTPSRMGGASKGLPLKKGRWNMFLRSEGNPDMPCVLDRHTVSSLPVHGEHDHRGYDFEARWFDHPQLHALADLTPQEQGPYHQTRLRDVVYPEARTKPLRDAVLYISYNGKQYSDSPRAIHEELMRRGGCDVEHLWLVRDGQVELPDTLRPIRFQSTEWYEALARCRYIVTNAHLPHWMERRPEQVIVQTWHGTMLKKIGLDIEAPKFNPDYHEQLRMESAQWSMLVSSNRFSTPILKRAMGYDGRIVESGYPRNDYLYAPDREKRAAEIRRRIGIPEGKKVVLYAPTWRDDLAHRVGQFRFELHLDLADAQRRLGEDHVLMIRRHSNVVDSIPGAGNGFVFDVSEYPDIADLYIAADMMITDYSSVMFDFAHLRRPMLFFTYDLEHYRDRLRGFYFDFEKDAPGPLIHTSEELVTAIRDIDRVSEKYSSQYDEFHRLFCDLDDGHAAARVADLMFEQAREFDARG